MAPIEDGTYKLVNSVVQSFTAAGVSREQVERFGAIARAVEAGVTSADEAQEQIKDLGGPFANLWARLGQNSGQIQTLIAVIALFLLIYFEQQSSADAAKLQQAVEMQTQETQSAALVEQKILAELRKLSAAALMPETPPSPKQQTQAQAPPQTPVKETRQQRRRAEQLAKKKARQRP